MKELFIAATLMVLISCGKQTYEVEVNDSNQSISGETKNIIIVELAFISQVNELCKDLNIMEDFTSNELYNQEVARCTFDKISILNIGDISQDGFNDIINDLCQDEQYSNEPICQ
jgi:uncharacterized lipoprotein YajG